MSRSDKQYGVGLILVFFGGSGLAECITSNRGSFLISVIVFAIGLGLILDSYVERK